jgi:hypothetical protein
MLLGYNGLEDELSSEIERKMRETPAQRIPLSNMEIDDNIRIIQAAKFFLLDYFSDGITRRPETFDQEILGVSSIPAVLNILNRELPAWNNTVFCSALGELISEGKIKAWKDDTGWYYVMAK